MSEKKDWIVRMRCVVDKDVFLKNCTEEEAMDSPWSYVESEQEVDMRDWEITNIEENK